MIAALLLAVAAAVFWAAAQLHWCRVEAEPFDGLTDQRAFEVKGSAWSPWLTPLALVLLAAIAAALSVRGWGLRLIAILVAAGGVVAAVPVISLLTDGADAGYAGDVADMPDRYQVLFVDVNEWAVSTVLVGAAVCVAAGVFLLRAARGGVAPASKYRTPAARRDDAEREIFRQYEERKAAQNRTPADRDPDGPEPAEPTPGGASERMLWDALDTGLDPTELDVGGDPRPDSGGR
ncbi:TIGR02234 family membrane protein [Gordonia pseudamarae]|uniref:TIGR02234 family membrane protein n=2 Tax=Gordonia pseudamarae TaxID=2831662 RepID=A0ABX6IRK0_9ACTN|nr:MULTISPECIES: TIGR02234 family membrane protein [Gordonia]MBD0022973.1 TIGR02234 family membrane protein [Gordonia sp. (in: high G+C Gram-positive bacteria)]QHN28685.1 TIGR02234 family membrane protein [Gordonia pseudamarae]QHN37558.1 TIGR02234 family membrane protein [Gordonia pseudamarae]